MLFTYYYFHHEVYTPNCNGDSFPVLCRDYYDRFISHDLIGLHMTLSQRTCSQDRT